MRIIALLLLIAIAMSAAERGEEIPLWANDAPGSEGMTKAQEVSKPAVDARYKHLPGNFTVSHVPSIFVFLPPAAKATGASMIVAPGAFHGFEAIPMTSSLAQQFNAAKLNALRRGLGANLP